MSQPTSQLSLSNVYPNLGLKYYQSVHELPNVWEALEVNDIFLERSFLECLEKYPPENMSFVYFVYFDKSEIVGFCIGQIHEFRANKSINSLHTTSEKGFRQKVKIGLSRFINYQILTIGNLLLAGDHTFFFKSDYLQKLNIARIIHETTVVMKPFLKKKNIGIITSKEYYGDSLERLSELKTLGYSTPKALPNMIFPVRNNWLSFADYLQDLQSKSRTRAKRAFKKGKDIIKKELSLEAIKAQQSEIHQLYQATAKGADFNLLDLDKGYFYGLKAHLKDNFKLVAYYLEDKLIGFFTMIFNYKSMDAHFLGINSKYNFSHQVYLNMLFDLVHHGIENQVQQVVMARTATEIKSSIGAVPYEMTGFARMRNPIFNKILQRLTDYFVQSPEWTPRQPFKEKVPAPSLS
ncbi:MAG: hypothetical protein ACPG19_04775 [Saprospiraceae bacterium]